MNIAVLGSNPHLSLAELISLYGASVKQHAPNTALVDSPIDIDRLGGTMKVAEVVKTISAADWPTISKLIQESIDEWLPQGVSKHRIGISLYGITIHIDKYRQWGLEIKKQLRTKGIASRVVLGDRTELSTAKVQHNNLIDKGLELVVSVANGQTYIGRTTAVQDITAYTARDRKRPFRDARIGMLPPKLAQIMLNLAHPAAGTLIADPFCGTGVIVQEALLAGHPADGSDLNEVMVDYTRKNLEWLQAQHPDEPLPKWSVSEADARAVRLNPATAAIVSETYLGPAISRLPYPNDLDKIRREVDGLIHDFLVNVAKQTKVGVRVCIAVPVWQTPNGLSKLPGVDQIERLGYNFRKFNGLKPLDLIYRRPDQIVGRQLLVLERA